MSARHDEGAPRLDALLADRVVLVVGAGPGLGRHVASRCARAGAAVVLGARSAGSLDAVEGEVRQLGGRAVSARCDVTVDEDCARLVALAQERFGRLDAVVYNAYHGGAMTVPAAEADLALWRDVYDVNVFGLLRVLRHAVPMLDGRGTGSVVVVNSQSVRRPIAGRGDYVTSKAALMSLVQVLARELGPSGIRVNSIVPGRMRGPALLAHWERVATAAGTSVEDEEAQVVPLLALPRLVTDEEVARSVLYLVSDLAAGVTGQSLDVNAGETMHW